MSDDFVMAITVSRGDISEYPASSYISDKNWTLRARKYVALRLPSSEIKYKCTWERVINSPEKKCGSP